MASDPKAEPSDTTPDAAPAPKPALAAGGGLPDPLQILRSRGYVMLLVLAALAGIPIAAAAWGFLALIHVISNAAYETLPHTLGYATVPTWWPLPVLFFAGIIIAIAIKYLPGNGGHSPADGFNAGATEPIWLPGVIIAALAGISLGVVLGPEAPLIALGSGLAIFFMRRLKPDTDPTSQSVFAAAGSFAALGTIFGSPIVAAFFMMEAVGFGGTMMSTVLLPGLVASGVGSLIFVGLGHWSGLGTFSLEHPESAALHAPRPGPGPVGRPGWHRRRPAWSGRKDRCVADSGLGFVQHHDLNTNRRVVRGRTQHPVHPYGPSPFERSSVLGPITDRATDR